MVGVAVLATTVLAGVALLLERRSAGRFESVVEAAATAPAPLDLVVPAGRAHRFLFLTDVPGSETTKRLAAEAVERLARGTGVDALVVAVGVDQQAWIDGYLASQPEDVATLLARPAAAGGPGAPLLPLYRRIRELNRELGAARSVRVVAADLPDWPPSRPVSPSQAVRRHGERMAHMLEIVEDRVLEREPRARIVFFVDGLQALRLPHILRTGGAAPVRIEPLASRLMALYPREVWGALVDPVPIGGGTWAVAAYRGTEAHEPLRRAAGRRPIALRTAPSHGAARDWLRISTEPGIELELVDRQTPLADVADVYIYLPE